MENVEFLVTLYNIYKRSLIAQGVSKETAEDHAALITYAVSRNLITLESIIGVILQAAMKAEKVTNASNKNH